MANLILMMGAPGSGKTTLAKKMFGEKDVYVSRDQIRFAMVPEGEPYFSKEKEVFNEFVRQIQAGIDNKEKRYVIADATHLNPGSRLKLLNRLDRFGIKTHIIYVRVPLEIALERNSHRVGRELVPEKTIKDMYDSIAAPIKEEKIDFIWVANEQGIIDIKYERKGDK